MGLLVALILGSIFFSKFLLKVIFISFPLQNAYEYENFTTELQERLPEFRVFSGFFKPSIPLKVLVVLLGFCCIQFSFKKLIRMVREVLLPAIVILLVFLRVIQSNDFEITLEGRTIYLSENPQEIPSVDYLVDLIQEKSLEITLPRAVFLSAPFAILYILKHRFIG